MDLYIILGSADDSKLATFQVYINPMVAWLWLGGCVLVLGTFVAVIPWARLRVRARVVDPAVVAGRSTDAAPAPSSEV